MTRFVAALAISLSFAHALVCRRHARRYVKAWEKEHGKVPAGAFAALRTDMSKDWTANPERFKRSPFPAWSLAAIKFLFDERKVTAIGHESLDTDTTEAMDSETWILKQNHYQIEAMANLDKVPPAGAVIVVT
jgi:kynurenine formamidase